jgi:hypothetical protein
VRARELARNDARVPAKLHNKVERARGAAIGLDGQYEYFRYRPAELTRADDLKIAADAVAAFEAA